MVIFLPDVSSKGSSPCVLKKGDMLVRLRWVYQLLQFFAVTQYLGCVALFLYDIT
jgi:hypothetical protein